MRSALAASASWIEICTWSRPRLRQPLQPLARQQHAGGDEIGVEADLGRLRHDLLEVAAHGGLAARQMQLQDAEIGCLRQHVEPYLGRQLAGGALQRQRIGAVGALQRAAVRQLGEQPDREPARRPRCPGAVRGRAHAVTTPLSARSCSMGTMSARMRSTGRAVGLRQLAGDGLDAAAAVAQLQHGDGDGIGREHPLRRQDQPAVARGVVAHLDMARQLGRETADDRPLRLSASLMPTPAGIEAATVASSAARIPLPTRPRGEGWGGGAAYTAPASRKRPRPHRRPLPAEGGGEALRGAGSHRRPIAGRHALRPEGAGRDQAGVT